MEETGLTGATGRVTHCYSMRTFNPKRHIGRLLNSELQKNINFSTLKLYSNVEKFMFILLYH
jgi:hypothetical protein